MAAMADEIELSEGLWPRLLYLVVVSLLATAVATIVGTVFIMAIGFPLSLAAIIVWPVILSWLWNGAILATPVTLVLLPAAVALGHRHPAILYFLLPLVGLVGGLIAMKVWPHIAGSWPELAGFAKTHLAFYQPARETGGHQLPLLAGAISGLCAGAVFSAAVHEMRR